MPEVKFSAGAHVECRLAVARIERMHGLAAPLLYERAVSMIGRKTGC